MLISLGLMLVVTVLWVILPAQNHPYAFNIFGISASVIELLLIIPVIISTASLCGGLDSECRQLVRVVGLVLSITFSTAFVLLYACQVDSILNIISVFGATSCVYSLIYFWFSSTNYEELNVDFTKAVLFKIIGKKTIEAIEQERVRKK